MTVLFTDVFAVCDECHPRASCVRVGKLQYGCECLRGFQGDGLTCVGEFHIVAVSVGIS